MRFTAIPAFLFLSLFASTAFAATPSGEVVEVTDTVECENMTEAECRAYLPALPDVTLTAPALTTANTDLDYASGDVLLFGGGQLPVGGLSGGFGGAEIGGAWCPTGSKLCLRGFAAVGMGTVGLFEVSGGAGLLVRDLADRVSLMISFFGSLVNDDEFRFAQAAFGANLGIRVRIIEGLTAGLHVPLGVAFDKDGGKSPLIRVYGGAGWEF